MLIYGINWLCTDFCPVYHICALKSIFPGFTFGVPKTRILERKGKCRLHLKLPETVPEKTCTNGRRQSVERRKFEGHLVEGQNEIHKTTKHRKTWIKTLNDITSDGTQHQNTIRLTVKNVNIFCFVLKHRKHNKISHRKHQYLCLYKIRVLEEQARGCVVKQVQDQTICSQISILQCSRSESGQICIFSPS